MRCFFLAHYQYGRHMYFRENNYIYIGIALLAGALILASMKYSHHISNLFGYVFLHKPYINRVLQSRVIYVTPGDALFNQMISDPDMDDRRWGSANFSAPISERVTVPHTKTQLDRYQLFLESFFAKFLFAGDLTKEPSGHEMATFIHRLNKQNDPKAYFDPTPFEQKAEKDRHADDLVFFYVNYRAACGTVAETSVALLRALGFRTRLMFMSNTKGDLIANHVFMEYFSYLHGKWVMFDAFENFTPTSNNIPMSAFEFFSNPHVSDQYKSGGTYMYYVPGSQIGYFKVGPVTTSYRLAI